MKVLFLHGLESNPGGSKVQHLLDLGHTVLNPALPKHDFEESVRIAQEEVDTNHPDVIVGSSRGGAVAMAVDRAGARLVLIAPAWQRFGGAASVPPGTSVLHCTTDDQVPFSDSEQLQGANLIPCGEGHRMIDSNALETLGHAVEGTLKSESLVREYVREQILFERAEAETSLLSGVGDFIESRHYDDMMDDVFKRLAPGLVRHVMEQEINEDVAEFLDGAIEGRWEKQRGWSFEDPSPKEMGHSDDSADYILGYTWGWNNASTWKGNQLPTQARKEAVETQIKEFEDQISEQMVIAALETANEKVNPIKLIKKAIGAIRSAVQEEGLAGGLKKGLPIAIGIIVGEALDNFIIPMAFFSMTGIPIPPLPIGVGEIINPVVISIVGGDMGSEEIADELGWYEGEYGEASSLGPRETNELREYIREQLLGEAYATMFGKPTSTPGKKNVYRGMKITMPSAQLASLVRKTTKGQDVGMSSGEVARFVLAALDSESSGVSWSESFDVAVSFADVWSATNRGKTLHIILQATIDDESGYDPITSGEEPHMFWDENEVRMEQGAEMPVTAVYVFIKSKDEWAKQRSQFGILTMRDEEDPIMVKA